MNIGPAVDIYAMGGFIFELVTGRMPYYHIWKKFKNKRDACARYKKAVANESANGGLPDIQYAEGCFPGTGYLIYTCFQREPSDRPSAPALHKALVILAGTVDLVAEYELEAKAKKAAVQLATPR